MCHFSEFDPRSRSADTISNVRAGPGARGAIITTLKDRVMLDGEQSPFRLAVQNCGKALVGDVFDANRELSVQIKKMLNIHLQGLNGSTNSGEISGIDGETRKELDGLVSTAMAQFEDAKDRLDRLKSRYARD